jgi:hypothetical protein
MHRPSTGPRFFFNAHAVGFSGKITKPFDAMIDAQASCALPPDGGYVSARVENFRLKEVISFSAAYTQVNGSAHDEEEAWNQVATSTIENLNIQGQLTADRITAVMSIKRPYQGNPIFRIIGCRFDNLTVGGSPATVEFNQAIDTWEAAGDHFQPLHRDIIVGSAALKVTSPFLTEGNVLDVPDFGLVTLGEYLITPYARSLSMFRVEMGCGTEGDGGGGYVGGNGSRYPP